MIKLEVVKKRSKIAPPCSGLFAVTGFLNSNPQSAFAAERTASSAMVDLYGAKSAEATLVSSTYLLAPR